MIFRKIAKLLYCYIAGDKKNNLTIQQYNNYKLRGFTLIELMIVLGVTAVLGILGIAGFINYNQIQVLQSAASELTNTLNLARSRALSQIKPPASVCLGQLDGYGVSILFSPRTYTLYVVCSGSDNPIPLKTTTLPDKIIFADKEDKDVFFPVLGGRVEGAGTIAISGYGQRKNIVISEGGIFASAAIPTTIPAFPTPTITPTPTPTPTPIPASASYKRIFVTSTVYNANLGGLSGADAKCQTRASVATLGGTWKAWLSDSVTSAKDRLTQATVPYKLLNGANIANNWTDLTNGSIASPINVTETGRAPSSSSSDLCDRGTGKEVWTNTNSDGQNSGRNTCSDWTTGTTSGAQRVAPGRFDSTTTRWTSNCGLTSTTTCESVAYLYCFEQ